MANSSAQIIARYANDHHDIKRIAIELMPPESQIPIASQAASRRFAIRLALFYGAIFGLLGSYLPFFPVWLKADGIEASWIGIITAVPAVTRFTVLPFVTGLAERRQSLRNAIIITAFATALGLSVVGTQHRALLVFVAFAATCCLWTPLAPLTDAYALRGVSHYGLHYGPLRLWGSAAFVVGALACGLLVDLIEPIHLIWVIAAIAGLSGGARWIIPAQDPPIAILAVVQLAHGLTFGLTQVGTMGLLVHHVPGHVMARGQGYLAACSGIVASSTAILCGIVYARYGQGVYYLMAAMALSGALLMWLAPPRLPAPPPHA